MKKIYLIFLLVTSFTFGQFNPIFFAGGGQSDPNARAFIIAAGITDATQKTAIHALVKDLKNAGLWNAFYAIYPIVGGTATSHKFNLKNPVDSDAAFRLVFNGGITHSSSGMKGNGTTGYADTKFNINTLLALNDLHFSYYSTENTANDSFIGLASGSGVNGCQMTLRSVFYTDKIHGSIGQSIGDATLDNMIANSTDSRGLFSVSRVGTSEAMYRNNSSIATKTTTLAGSVNSGSFYLLSRQLSGAASTFDTRNCAFVTIGFGLNSTQIATLYTIIQKFQTTLGRQV